MDDHVETGFAQPSGPPEQAAVAFTPSPASFTAAPRSAVMGAVERNRARLLAIDGVEGVAEGRTPIGDEAVVLYVAHDGVRGRVPATVEGHPVDVVVVPGGFDILPASAASGA